MYSLFYAAELSVPLLTLRQRVLYLFYKLCKFYNLHFRPWNLFQWVKVFVIRYNTFGISSNCASIKNDVPHSDKEFAFVRCPSPQWFVR